MRTRVHKVVSSQPDTVKPTVTIVRLKNATKLVTLDDPTDSPQEARGAFARLQPPPGMTDDEVASWRILVAQEAIACKVLPIQRDAEVPEDSARVEEGEEIGTIRQEAMILAEATEKSDVVNLVREVLDEVGAT